MSMAIAGCTSNHSTPPATSTSNSEQQRDSGMNSMKEGLAKLAPEDAAAAERQHICPVSGEMLGTMGTPLKVHVKDQDVWICCEGCKDQLITDPDTYLAKLGHP